MKGISLALFLLLAGCGRWFPAAVGSHTSGPDEGRPFNSNCDPSADYLGFGAGTVIDRHIRAYLTLGAKHLRQCGAPNDLAIGANALIIKEFHGKARTRERSEGRGR